VSNIAGSSVESEHGTRCAISAGSGCSFNDATTPVRRFEIGQTSRTVRRSASSRTRPGSSTAHAVADPARAERLQRAGHGRGAGRLPGVRHGPGLGEDRRKRLRRDLRLEAAEPEADHPSVAKRLKPTDQSLPQ
jgi:hypothetical protein